MSLARPSTRKSPPNTLPSPKSSSAPKLLPHWPLKPTRTHAHRNSFLGAIRTRTTLPPTIRELAICRVAVLNRAWYEWAHHAPLLRAAADDGNDLTDADMEYIVRRRARAQTLRDDDTVTTATPDEDVRAEKKLGERLVAVLDYTDAMTMDVRVPEEVFGRVRALFGEREVVEITATVAAYNCVSRFLVALDVGEKNGNAGPDV